MADKETTMSVLADYLKTEAGNIRDESARLKAAKLDWQRAAQDLVNRMTEWLLQSDPDRLLQVKQTDHVFEDYDVGSHVVKGVSITLGRGTVRITPSPLEVLGVIQVPGETGRRRIDGRFVFDNGTDRIPLYRVKEGDRDVWLWWTHGGVGKPFDRESFEATIVSLLQ
jgi:hypothetical protein